MTIHVPEPKTIDSAALAQIFTDARTHNVFLDKPVSDELLRKAIELAKMGPTSANQSPMRVLFLRSHAAKERLRPALARIRRKPRPRSGWPNRQGDRDARHLERHHPELAGRWRLPPAGRTVGVADL